MMGYRTLNSGTFLLLLAPTVLGIATELSVAGDGSSSALERQSWHPEGLVAVVGGERGRKWDLAGRGLDVRPDGRQVATGGGSGAIYLWNAETMQLERMLHGQEGPIRAVQYSPDGATLTSVGFDNIVREWELSADGGMEASPVAHFDKAPINVISSADRGTFVFDGSSQARSFIWRRVGNRGWRVAATMPPGERMPAAEIPDDIAQLAKTLGAEGMSASSSAILALSGDGSLMAVSSGGRAIWLETEGDGVATYVSSTVSISHIGGRESEKLWTLEGVGYVGAMAFSPDGRLLAIGTHDNVVRTFSIGSDPPEIRHEITMPSSIKGICFDPYGETLAVAAGKVRLWNLFAGAATPGMEAPITRQNGGTVDMTFSPDGRTLYYVDGKIVRRWDVAGAYVEEIEANGPPLTAVHSLSYTPDGTQLIAAVERDGPHKVSCWNTDRLEAAPIWELDFADRRTDDLTVSPNGQRFVFSAYNHLQYALELWESAGDEPVQLDVADLEDGHPGSFWCNTFSPDGTTLATGHRDGAIRMWDTSGVRVKLLRTFAHVHRGGVGGLDYASDGNALAAVDWGGNVHIWKAAGDGLQKAQVAGRHGSRAYTVQFSPDGRLLATGDYGGKIKLWDVSATPATSVDLVAHTAHVSSLDFATDGRRLLSAGQDGRVIVWDVVEMKPLAQWRFPGLVFDAKFDPSGQSIATANGNGTIYVWRP